MKNDIKHLLADLVAFARTKDIKASFWLHVERSTLMRFANGAISLNTTEDVMTLDVTVHRGNARGSCSLVTNLGQRDQMQRAILDADDLARHATPVHYTLSFTPMPSVPDDDGHFDQTLLDMPAQDKLAFMSRAVEGLESPELPLAGMFSSGAVWQAAANTLNDNVLFHATTDACVTVVLTHAKDKRELQATQSAAAAADLDPARLRTELAQLLDHYRACAPVVVPPGTYDVVFGREAYSDLLGMCSWIGFSGGGCKRKATFLKEADLGRAVFSDKVTMVDDPTVRETFPYAFDCNGVVRKPFPLVERGVFKAFMWDRDSADEFSQKETGHSVPARSLVLSPGTARAASLADMIAMPRERDILFIPFLHYMNVVNDTEGIVTCCSRFGALLLKKDGTVQVPFNVRMTEKLANLFGNIEWLSSTPVAVNSSSTYGTRNATAVMLPMFAKVKGVAITHANQSF